MAENLQHDRDNHASQQPASKGKNVVQQSSKNIDQRDSSEDMHTATLTLANCEPNIVRLQTVVYCSAVILICARRCFCNVWEGSDAKVDVFARPSTRALSRIKRSLYMQGPSGLSNVPKLMLTYHDRGHVGVRPRAILPSRFGCSFGQSD